MSQSECAKVNSNLFELLTDQLVPSIIKNTWSFYSLYDSFPESDQKCKEIRTFKTEKEVVKDILELIDPYRLSNNDPVLSQIMVSKYVVKISGKDYLKFYDNQQMFLYLSSFDKIFPEIKIILAQQWDMSFESFKKFIDLEQSSILVDQQIPITEKSIHPEKSIIQVGPKPVRSKVISGEDLVKERATESNGKLLAIEAKKTRCGRHGWRDQGTVWFLLENADDIKLIIDELKHWSSEEINQIKIQNSGVCFTSRDSSGKESQLYLFGNPGKIMGIVKSDPEFLKLVN